VNRVIKCNCKLLRGIRTFLIGFLFLFPHTGNAQEVLCSGGDSHKTDKLEVSWTLGELSIESLNKSNLILTQGMQQSMLEVTVVGGEEEIDLLVYPNPTLGELHHSTNFVLNSAVPIRFVDDLFEAL
jgi:hypothetical protein